MFNEDKILIISELGVEGLSLLVKIALKYGDIVWLSSNSYLPFKVLEANSYKGNAKIFGLYSQTGQVVNPLDLNEISLAIHRAGGGKRPDNCVIISCLSELIMYHGIKKTHAFLLSMMNTTKKFIGMLIDNAQDKKDELLVSTLFDAVFRLERKSMCEAILIPELHFSAGPLKLKYKNGIIEFSEFSDDHQEIVASQCEEIDQTLIRI